MPPTRKAPPVPANPHLGADQQFDPTVGGAGNLTKAWARAWRLDPDQPAIHDPDEGWISRGELERDSAQRAGRLARLGLERGDRVLLSAESGADLVRSYLACLRLGLIVIPTNTAYGPRELAHVLSDARPRLAIVDEPGRDAAIAGIDSKVLRSSPALALDEGPIPELDGATPRDAALLCYTSGTTGNPKGALLSHAHCLASGEALRLAWRWTERDRLLLALPLFHMHGLGVGLHGTLLSGGSAVLFRGFRPDTILAGIETFEATLFFGVPTMYHRLAQHASASALARLRLCVSGSAPLPAELHGAIFEKSGQRVLERYGMTETLMLVSNPYADDAGERRPGSVGFPLPGVELRLEGTPAEIQVRGPNVFEGYWERPDANEAAFTEDGWFRTGDLGEVDADGYVRIVGRAKELIISGGFNVYPREVEDVLRTHPDIEDVAVVGEASEEWGEVVTAYAVFSSTASNAPPLGIDSIRTFVGERLAAFKHPRALFAVEALPRNALGKVQKHRLSKGVVLPE